MVDSIAQKHVKTEENTRCKFCIDIKEATHNHQSPYFVSFKNEVPHLILNAGLFGVGLVIQKTNKAAPFTIEELGMLNRNSINKFDRGATYNNSEIATSVSDLLFNASMVLPSLVFLSNKHTRKDMLSLFVLGTEAFLISGGLNLNAKHIFNRTRPYTYNPSFPFETRTNSSSRLSFFSGHTSQTATATFFIAKVISDYHPNLKKGIRIGMWSTAVVLPALTGFLRVKSGRHYNSDVIAGFAIGAAVGWLVPHLNKKKKESKLSIRPYSYNSASGLTIILKN
ncbi:MAG: phosphatase PAP2 family protein [Saprospiraceae bacterium]